VGDHALDAFVVEVGGRAGVGQQQAGVEDVEALVLHGPEVEVAHGDDHEQVEVVLAAERLLVPLHRALEAVHGVGGPRRLAGVDIDAQGDLAAAHGGEAVGQFVEFAGHQGEQVAGLGEGVLPDREVAATGSSPLSIRLPFDSSQRSDGVALDAHRVAAQHVRPVGEVGDAAEALGLALGAVAAARHVEAHQGGVAGRVDLDLGGQGEGVGDGVDGQALGVGGIGGRAAGRPRRWRPRSGSGARRRGAGARRGRRCGAPPGSPSPASARPPGRSRAGRCRSGRRAGGSRPGGRLGRFSAHPLS
jgi:hypothetical protein